MNVSRRRSLTTLAAAALVPGIAGAQGERAAKPALKLVVFDVGGTLIEDHGEVPATMKAAFAHQGLTVSDAEIGNWRGAPKRGMIRHFVSERAAKGAGQEALTDAIYADFSQAADAAYKNVKPIAGAEAAMAALRKDGLLLASTTGFGRELNAAIFKRLGWGEQFAASINSDDVVDGRPAPFMIFHAMEAAHVENVQEVVVVGDTPLDLQAANNAGVRGVIGVYSGAASEARLRQERSTHILPSVAELPKLIRSAF